jgi:hypothetical protein
MNKSPNKRRKAPSKQSGNTQQDPTFNRVNSRLVVESRVVAISLQNREIKDRDSENAAQ